MPALVSLTSVHSRDRLNPRALQGVTEGQYLHGTIIAPRRKRSRLCMVRVATARRGDDRVFDPSGFRFFLAITVRCARQYFEAFLDLDLSGSELQA